MPQTPQSKLVMAINERVRLFQWAANVWGGYSESSLTPDEHDAVAKIVSELGNTRRCIMAPRNIPLAFWKLIIIPGSSVRLLKRHCDGKALACFLIKDTADFVRWQSVCFARPCDKALDEVVMDCLNKSPARTVTSFGSVHHAPYGSEDLPAIWFGVKRHFPSLHGAEITNAVRSLFQIGTR